MALNSVAPMQVVRNDSFTSVKVYRAEVELRDSFTFNVTYVGTEWQGIGRDRVRVGLYNFDLIANDWSVVTPGSYVLEMTLKPYYWIEDAHVGTVPLEVLPAIAQDAPIRFKDSSGVELPIDYQNGESPSKQGGHDLR